MDRHRQSRSSLRELVSLKPEVGDLGFLVVAVAKCHHGSQANEELEIGGEAVIKSEH